jgi:diguanylate cyclase (GGDEF)-like protein/PAS domain S-box-containing protein
MKRFLPSLVLFGLVAGLYLGGALEPLENRLLDARFRLTERPASTEIVLVTIDPASLKRLDVWPWPRGYHATVVENLLAAGAGRIGFDVDFSSRSDREEDAELASALRASGGRVVLPVFHQWEQGSGRDLLTATVPLPIFVDQTSLGAIHILPGRDGLVRDYGIDGPPGVDAVPSFAAAILDGRVEAPSEFRIDYGIAASSIPRLSYVDVLTESFDRSIVDGQVVIVGSTAVELGDWVAAPLVKAMPGPVLQAMAAESMVQGRALRPLSPLLSLATTLALALLVGPWLESRSWRAGLAAVTGLALVSAAASLAVQAVSPRILEASPWLVTLVGAYGYALVRRVDQQALKLLAQRLLLRRTEDLMELVVENSFDGIVMVGADGRVVRVNRAAEAVFGRQAADLIGLPVEDLITLPDDEPEITPSSLGPQPASGPWEVVGRRSGGPIHLEMTVSTVESDEENLRVAFLRDITERKAQRRALEHRASHDALTGLPNRSCLTRRSRQALVEAGRDRTPVALLLLDLIRFREINDTLGHHTGDQILAKIALRLRSPLGPGDTIARLDGDEFAVLLPDTGFEGAREMAWNLIDRLKQPFQVEGLSLLVDASIGIVIFPDHGATAEMLIQRGDVAMNAAKRERAKLAFYDPRHDFHSKRRLALTAELRGAIEEGKLSVRYQPKVSAETGRAIGVEVLVRWSHPDHGDVPPDEFIPIAEQSGLIRPLTLWVLETAVSQCAEWRRRGVEIGLSVNLSARNLLEKRLPDTLAGLLHSTGLPAEHLCLEITESVIMENPKKALEVLTEIAGLGVEISIDDFGTGYSSLGYLKKLPATEIKIDKSFVLEMDRNPDDETIVRSTIDLAHNLGLKVVAEGVERPGVWGKLKDLGCDYGQGYLFGAPMSPDEFNRWYRTEAEAEAEAASST